MKEMSWVWLGLASAVTAAAVTIFGRVGMARADPLTATTLRSIIMTVTLLVALTVTGLLHFRLGEISNLTTREWLYIAIAGVAGALSWLAYFAALRTGFAGKVAALDRLSIAFIFVFAALFLGERYTWKGWLGLLLILGGVFMIASDKPVSAES